MNYNVKNLKENLSEILLSLGIDTRILNNVAFNEVKYEIINLINNMNLGENSSSILVKEENGKISFDFESLTGNKYSFSINSLSKETFSCILVEEKKAYTDREGEIVKEKNAIELKTLIDSQGNITLTTNGSMIDTKGCDNNSCNNSIWSERKNYNTYGVMTERECKVFPKGKLDEGFDKCEVDSMLYIPRSAFVMGPFYNAYSSDILMVRDKLDTAKVHIEDTSNDLKYNGIIPLNKEYGLMNMQFPNKLDYFLKKNLLF